MIVLLSTSQVAIIKVWISQPAKPMTGLISGGDPRDPALWFKLVKAYIRKESYIVLSTVACKSPLVVLHLFGPWQLISKPNSPPPRLHPHHDIYSSLVFRL